ncbi:hypothetical protein [Streptomyces sp. HPF1205]|uniref:hypothetical protein n=1 Tax=Streptomyces sp. HPF1205 TaxID=2873262 RepID=UPI001CECE4B6|nr:hypothetical protein [Streptomyces sp. HPF1205]
MTTTPERTRREPVPSGRPADPVTGDRGARDGDPGAGSPPSGPGGGGGERGGGGDGSGDGGTVRDEPLPPRNPPRWVRWVVVPLLILVPLVYVVISADQSRDGGAEAEQEAAQKELAHDVPNSLLRRIYQVPIPNGTVGDAYMERNAWDHSEFYCQFTTNAGGLDTWLAQVGTSRSALADGKGAVTPGEARTAGWTFAPGRHWAGISLHQVGDKPDHDITVDLTNPDAPTVYVVSTVNFQHGFHGFGGG